MVASKPRLSWRLACAAVVAAGLVLAGCGGQAAGGGTSSAGGSGPSQAAAGGGVQATAAGGFAWLRPQPAPAGWHAAVIPSGAAMPYPPQWHPISGDPGTATAVLLNGDRQIIGYLNVTPKQGRESVSNWSRFRVDHNADEGDRSIKRLDVGAALHFRNGHGSCVRDSYTTGSGHLYVELACIVAGRRATTVIVGASPPAMWPRIAPMLERAIGSFTT